MAITSGKSVILAFARGCGLAAAAIMLSGAASSGKRQSANTLLRCDVKYSPSFKSPWLLYATLRTLDIEYSKNIIVDTTVNGNYHILDIYKNDSSWVVGRSTKSTLIKDYLNYDYIHKPEYAEITINKIDLSIRMDVRTVSHYDENDEYGRFQHVGSEVYVGLCYLVKKQI